MTCAWIETSSAETGSSQHDQLRVEREGAGDADPLALAAGELVRDSGRRSSGPARPASSSSRDPRRVARPPSRCRGSRSGSAMISPTVSRGFSDAYGSWKTICICAPQPAQRLARRAR